MSYEDDRLEQEQELDADELAGLEGEAAGAHLSAPWQSQLLELLQFMGQNREATLEDAAYALDMDVEAILRSADGLDEDEIASRAMYRGKHHDPDPHRFPVSPETDETYSSSGYRRLMKPEMHETVNIVASIITEDPDVFS
jgi:hypothetical protein